MIILTATCFPAYLYREEGGKEEGREREGGEREEERER